MEYQALLEKVQFIVQNIGCHIEMNQIDSAYMFTIYDNYGTKISSITTYKSTGTIVLGMATRRQKEIEDFPIFNISALNTEPAYTGQGFAVLILIYSICYLKQLFPEIDFVTLEDASDRRISIQRNIYDSLGFYYREPIRIDIGISKTIHNSSPDKQLLLDNEFVRRANFELDKKFGKKGGKKSRSTKRKRKTKGKTQRRRKRRI
jgi:hypothetical protein